MAAGSPQVAPASPNFNAVAWALFRPWALSVLIAPLPAAYIGALVLEVGPERMRAGLGALAPLLMLVMGWIWPLLLMRRVCRRALVRNADDRPGDRFVRILEVPRRLEVLLLVTWLVASALFVPAISTGLDRSTWQLAFAIFLGFCFGSMSVLVVQPSFERTVMPYALEEVKRDPSVGLKKGSPFFWPRQRWYLPYVVGVILVVNVSCGFAVVLAKLRAALSSASQLIAAGGPDLSERLLAMGPTLARDVAIHLAAYGLLAIGSAGLAAWGFARRQARASEAILASLHGLTRGEVVLPSWVATDEMGDLAIGTAQLMAQLDEVPKILRNSAVALAAAAEHLTATSNEQGNYLRNQAAALDRTRWMAETIRLGSVGAAQQTEVALKGAERADSVGAAGTESIAQSRAALDGIRTEVSEIAVTIKSMDDRSRQIGQVAETMQDLVEQTHVLAVNAAIEAARSGEQGVGFAVVAREMRTLVDKSAQAAAEVRQLLEKVREASGDAVERTLEGEKRVESGLAQIEASADKLRELLLINQSSSSALRQIAGIVRQQTTGVTEIFEALSSQQTLMDQTLARVESTVNAVESLEMVSHEVEFAMKGFGGVSAE